MEELARQIEALDARIDRVERIIASQVRSSGARRRLASIPGVAPIIAGAVLAMVPDPTGFHSARLGTSQPWLGFVPEQKSKAGSDGSNQQSGQSLSAQLVDRKSSERPALPPQECTGLLLARGLAEDTCSLAQNVHKHLDPHGPSTHDIVKKDRCV